MENNQSPETIPDAVNVAAAEGTQNVVPVLGLDKIQELTGRKYGSLEEAEKGLSETYKMVGRKQEPPKELVTEMATMKKQLQEVTFYDSHPELKEHKDLLARFGNPEEAIKDPVVLKALQALSTAAEQEKSVSVLNKSRIAGAPSDDYNADLAKTRETGDWVGFMQKYKGVEVPK